MSLAIAVRFVPASSGTVDFVYSSTVGGYRAPASGLVDGKTYPYRAESADLSQWEIGRGVWTAGTSTFARTTVQFSSTGSKVSFSAAPQVAITLNPEDVLQFDDAMTLTAAQQAMGRSNVSAALKGHIFGLTMTQAADANNDWTFAVGEAASTETNPVLMVLASSLIKQIDASWAVGTNAGGLDTGAVGNNMYAVWLIQRSDTGVVDVLYSLSATAPTMPTNYDRKRRIGWVIRLAGANKAVTQVDDEFYLTTPILELSAQSIGTSRTTVTASGAPPSTIGFYRIYAFCVASGATLVIQPFSETDAAPSAAGFSLAEDTLNTGSAGHYKVPIDSSSRFAIRAATASTVTTAYAFGWKDTRGRFA